MRVIYLIQRKRQGQGKPAIIYVKSFMEEAPENIQRLEKQTSEPEEKYQVNNSHLE